VATKERVLSTSSSAGSFRTLRSLWARQEAPAGAAPKLDAAKRDSKALVAVGARRSTTGTGRVRSKDSASSITKVRKTLAKTAKKTPTGRVKKAPAKTKAKRAKVARAS
jgi:dihydroxyacetone kinase-like predicted kinase